MASFGEILQYFKEHEDAENIVPLVDDEELRRGIVAWKSVVVRYKELTDCNDKDDASKWRWMWENVEFDQQDFGTVVGVKMQDVGRLTRRLMGFRLIYPDGTIHRLARQYLQTIILSKLPREKALKNTPKQEKSEPQSNQNG